MLFLLCLWGDSLKNLDILFILSCSNVWMHDGSNPVLLCVR